MDIGRCNFERRSAVSLDRWHYGRGSESSSPLISGPLFSFLFSDCEPLDPVCARWTRIDVIYSSTWRSLNAKTWRFFDSSGCLCFSRSFFKLEEKVRSEVDGCGRISEANAGLIFASNWSDKKACFREKRDRIHASFISVMLLRLME